MQPDFGERGLPATRGTSSSLAARYATALFELAEEEGALDRVARDLAAAREAWDAAPELQRIARNPLVERDRLQALAGELAERLGVERTVANFLRFLGRGRRLWLLPYVVERFEAMLAERRGEARAEAVSALPLTEEQVERLKRALEAGIGRRIRLETRVDPSLLGGLVVQIGSRMIDASLRTRLQQLELAMKGVA